jgi:hypothetical protein
MDTNNKPGGKSLPERIRDLDELPDISYGFKDLLFFTLGSIVAPLGFWVGGQYGLAVIVAVIMATTQGVINYSLHETRRLQQLRNTSIVSYLVRYCMALEQKIREDSSDDDETYTEN